jgi:hypothetical protein
MILEVSAPLCMLCGLRVILVGRDQLREMAARSSVGIPPDIREAGLYWKSTRFPNFPELPVGGEKRVYGEQSPRSALRIGRFAASPIADVRVVRKNEVQSYEQAKDGYRDRHRGVRPSFGLYAELFLELGRT